MAKSDEWLATLKFHLRKGPVIVSKYSLRIATEAMDTRNACRMLSRDLAPKDVQFVPMPDCRRVILL